MRLVLPFMMLASIGLSQNVSQTVPAGQETVYGIAESTDRYIPQIQHRYEVRLKLPENPKLPGGRRLGEPNTLPVGGLFDEPRGSLLSRFPGITATGWNPPDPTMACGPNHLVATVNSSMAFFTKAGSKTFEVDFGSFFSSLSPGSFIFDPKVFYDVHAQRFVVVVLEEDDATATSKVLFAISDDSDPSGTWFKYRLEAKATLGGKSCWGDYPGFGFNKDGYAVTLNMFPFDGSPAPGIQIMAIRKSSVLAGGAAVVTKFLDTGGSFSLQASENSNPTSDQIYLVNAESTTSLKIWKLGGLAGTPPTPTSSLLTVPTYEFPSGFGWECESPSARKLDGLDTRIINVAYRKSSLITTHSFEAATDARSRARWYSINIVGAGGPTLSQSGEVIEPGVTDRHCFMPSVAINEANDIAMIFTKSGAAGPVADIMRTARKSSDPLGTMGAPVLVKSSDSTPYGSSGFNRWGDYSSICVDPSDKGTFWAIHMTGAPGGPWTTEITSFAVSSVIKDITVPSMIYGGGTAFSATYTANVAPTAPTSVFLASSNATLASVPAFTTLGTGLTSGTFTVTTPTGVDVNKSVTLTATINGAAFTKLLVIRPAIMESLSLNFTTIAANQVVVATATLTGKAGPAGRTATLSSSTTAAAVPATLVYASGERTKTFNISTLNTKTTRTTVIGAVLGVTKGATLTVVPPPPLVSFVIAGTKTVVGGGSISSTATITSAAPAGGVRIKFTESSSFAALTTYKTVGAGTLSVTNTITTTAVATTQVVPITATLNGVTKTDSLTITP